MYHLDLAHNLKNNIFYKLDSKNDLIAKILTSIYNHEIKLGDGIFYKIGRKDNKQYIPKVHIHIKIDNARFIISCSHIPFADIINKLTSGFMSLDKSMQEAVLCYALEHDAIGLGGFLEALNISILDIIIDPHSDKHHILNNKSIIKFALIGGVQGNDSNCSVEVFFTNIASDKNDFLAAIMAYIEQLKLPDISVPISYGVKCYCFFAMTKGLLHQDMLSMKSGDVVVVDEVLDGYCIIGIEGYDANHNKQISYARYQYDTNAQYEEGEAIDADFIDYLDASHVGNVMLFSNCTMTIDYRTLITCDVIDIAQTIKNGKLENVAMFNGEPAFTGEYTEVDNSCFLIVDKIANIPEEIDEPDGHNHGDQYKDDL